MPPGFEGMLGNLMQGGNMEDLLKMFENFQ